MTVLLGVLAYSRVTRSLYYQHLEQRAEDWRARRARSIAWAQRTVQLTDPDVRGRIQRLSYAELKRERSCNAEDEA